MEHFHAPTDMSIIPPSSSLPPKKRGREPIGNHHGRVLWCIQPIENQSETMSRRGRVGVHKWGFVFLIVYVLD